MPIAQDKAKLNASQRFEAHRESQDGKDGVDNFCLLLGKV